MKTLIHSMMLGATILTLIGCASTTDTSSNQTASNSNSMTQGSMVPSNDYLNREVIASPAAKISAGSGAMHGGMGGR